MTTSSFGWPSLCIKVGKTKAGTPVYHYSRPKDVAKSESSDEQCPKWFRLVQDVDILGTELGSLQESDPDFVINLGVLWSRFIDS